MLTMSCPMSGLSGDSLSEMEAKLRARGFDVRRAGAPARALPVAAQPAPQRAGQRAPARGAPRRTPAPPPPAHHLPTSARDELASLLRRALVAYQQAAGRQR